MIWNSFFSNTFQNKVSGLVSTSRKAWFTKRRAIEVSGRTALTTREENAGSFSKTSCGMPQVLTSPVMAVFSTS